MKRTITESPTFLVLRSRLRVPIDIDTSLCSHWHLLNPSIVMTVDVRDDGVSMKETKRIDTSNQGRTHSLKMEDDPGQGQT